MYGTMDSVGKGLLINVYHTIKFIADNESYSSFYPYIQYLNQKPPICFMKLKRSFLILTTILIFLFQNIAIGQKVSGELKKWHKLSLEFEGPNTSEAAEDNPFLNYRLNVAFKHTSTGKTYLILAIMLAMAMQGTPALQQAIFGKYILPLMKLGNGPMRWTLRKGNGRP